jgi:hypothetical protein
MSGSACTLQPRTVNVTVAAACKGGSTVVIRIKQLHEP